MKAWLALALEPDVRARAVKVAAVVGTVLAAINHGDGILGGAMSPTAWLKVALTYVVPYCVSTYASVQTMRHARADARVPSRPASQEC